MKFVKTTGLTVSELSDLCEHEDVRIAYLRRWSVECPDFGCWIWVRRIPAVWVKEMRKCVQVPRLAAGLPPWQTDSDGREAAHSKNCVARKNRYADEYNQSSNRCVNPAHVRAATASENKIDRVIDGNNPMSKIMKRTAEEVNEFRVDVRRCRDGHVAVSYIAEVWGLHVETMRMYVDGRLGKSLFQERE